MNPKSWLAAMAGVSAHIGPRIAHGGWADGVLFAGLFCLAALPAGFAWPAAGAALQRMLRRQCAAQIIIGAMAAALLMSVGLIFV